jgi:hypothetical protein
MFQDIIAREAFSKTHLASHNRHPRGRGAGVLGMMKLGTKAMFAPDADLNIVDEEVLAFVEKHREQPFLIFGFTFLVRLKPVKHFDGRTLDLSNAVIVHLGGCKKMEGSAFSNEVFRARIGELFGTTRI